MFVKQIKKRNKNADKQYIYYRLVHTYKIGNKVRHQNILSLGGLETLPRERHKALADRIEELVTGNNSTLFPDTDHLDDIDPLARKFAKKIIDQKLFVTSTKKKISKEIRNNIQEIDLESIEQIDSKEIGGEWLVKQAFEKLEIASVLAGSGLDGSQIDIAQMLLTGKLLHPSSELEAERWLKENSGTRELYPTKADISRYRLYGAAEAMYKNKDAIERDLYNQLCSLFSGRTKIVIYDLTNMHFTGQMLSSNKADFGRSKQKQTGSKLIGLALSIDSLGFVRYSKFYNGNISEPETFEDMLSDVTCQLDTRGEKPIIVMDAGIATEDNLKLIRGNKYNYDYVCVSRTVPKDFTKPSITAESVSDNRGNKIELTKAHVEAKDDCFLHIKSDQKLKKEVSIDNKLTLRLETQLQDIKDKLPRKGTLKKAEKVHEKVGRIKAKLSKIGWLYDIKYTEDKEKGIVTDINWNRVKERERPKGEYFLRYTNNTISESDIWDVYNMTRDVEAVFRCLKTDLKVRPIHHQKDKYIEPHIWLGIMAYQIVNYIRKGLKENNIDYSWTTIVEKMKSMQSSIVTMNSKENEKIYVKLCTRPTIDQQLIFDSLNFKHRPFVRKTKVVPQL